MKNHHKNTPRKQTVDRIIRIELISAKNMYPVDMSSGEAYFSVVVGNEKKRMKVSRKTRCAYFSSPENRFDFRQVSTKHSEIFISFQDHEKKKEVKDWGISINVNKLLPFNTNHIRTFTLQPKHLTSENSTSPIPSLSPKPLGDVVLQPSECKAPIECPEIVVSMYLFPERNNKTDRLYRTPTSLFSAVLNADLFMVLTLLENPKVDVNAQDGEGNTALHLASLVSYNEHIILSLLRHSPTIDVNKTNNYDANTPFHFFCKNYANPNCQEAIDLFFRHGVDVEAKNRNGETPLHYAVRNNCIRMLLVTRLLEKNANVNAQTNRSSTVLHYAVHNERTDLLSVLLEYGADFTLKDDSNQTPYDVARTKSARYCKSVTDYKELLDYLQEIHASKTQIATIVKNKLFKYKLRNQTARTLDKIGINEFNEKMGLLQKFKLLPETHVDEKFTTTDENEDEQRKKLLALIEEGKFVIEPNEIEFLANIGSGASGIVYSATYKKVTVAVKTLKSTNLDEVKEFQQEFGVLSKLKNDNIVRFYGVVVEKQFSMVMEHCNKGSLFDIISKKESDIGWETVFDYSEQIAKGMHYLHSRSPPILHRDLKSLNVLVTSEEIEKNGKTVEVERLKICDFGLSRFDSDITVSVKGRGTYAYCAPEVYFNQRYSDQSDVYSYGIILWELVFRVIYQRYQRPFQEFPELNMDIQIIIQSATCDLRPTIPPSTPLKMATLIRQCVVKEQENRPRADAILLALQGIRKDYTTRPEMWNTTIIH
ncbi:Protein kinase domain-containing protein [Entamoeba marina]